ncbi:MAG: MMPL family transporter [Thermodesulfobacteriota bacterium]
MIKQYLKTVTSGQLLERMLQRPVVVILAVLLITALFAWRVPYLSFKTSVYDLIIEDLPETARYEAFKEIFGSDELIRVVVKGENLFDAVAFKQLEVLVEAAEKIEGVRRVISLPGVKNAVDLSGKWELSRFSDVLDDVALFRKNLYSPDGKSTILTLVLENGADPDAVVAAIKEMIAAAPASLSLYQIGMPLVSQAMARLTQRDFFKLPPITFLLIALVLFLLYRKLIYVVLPLGCVGIALVWNFGLMSLTGIPLSMLTMIVPVFLIAVGTAYCLHIIAEYLLQAKRAPSPVQASIETFRNITLPTTLAVATTLVGLGSLLVNRITAIQEFAIFACLGIAGFLVILLTFLPAVMALVPLPGRETTPDIGKYPETGQNKESLLDRLLDFIATINIKYQKYTLPLIGALIVFCVVGIFKVPVESNPVGYFKDSTEISRNFHDIYQNLSGCFPINVTLNGREEDFFEDAQHIADLAKIQQYMETLPGVDKTISFADYLQLVNYASNRFEAKHYRLPEEAWEVRMLINGYKTMLGDDMLARFMSPGLSQANILLLTHISSSAKFLETRAKILEFAQAVFGENYEIEVTGFGMVISESSHQLTSGQIKSLSITMVLVFGIMFVLFLSSKVGFIAIIPNMFPIIVNFGIMGWLGIELSMFTSLIASIAIGLAVDDTIHYLVRYNREFRKDLDDQRALRDTLRHIGRPVIYTTLTISIGFSILTLSSFKPTAIFGILMAVTMFSALVGDLILLPSLLLHAELVTLWDLIRLKLGKDPGFGIPLFNGLSRTQIHYIIMAGTLKKIGAGQVLFYKGDESESMCALVSGSMDVVERENDDVAYTENDVYKQINRLGAGDIVGEMGLLRSAPRSATVVATSPSEFLEINLKMIKRLQWLYPPTANRFFFNLMRILCDRIEQVTNDFTCRSVVDDLTGWCNRKGFDDFLDVEFHRSLRYGENLSVCLMDIDFEVADLEMSYDIKDRNLRVMGEALSRIIRKSDTLGRLDAGTFALLMPATPLTKALPVCTRLADILMEKRLDVDGIRINVALGMAEFIPGQDASALDLMGRAHDDLDNKKPANQ